MSSTHELIAAKLKSLHEGVAFDKEKAEAVRHSVLDTEFYVLPMTYAQQKEWRDIQRFEDIKHAETGRSEADPKDTRKSDIFLLSNCVYTEDGVVIGREMADQILGLPFSGADSLMLIAAAEKLNPPRSGMAWEVAQMLRKDSADMLLWRILFECGLSKCLIDYMTKGVTVDGKKLCTEEEVELASRQLLKAEILVYALQPYFYADDIAKELGVTFAEGMALLADNPTANLDDTVDKIHEATRQQE